MTQETNYYRICRALNDYGSLVPEDTNPYSLPQFNEQGPLYRSVFKYSDRHLTLFKDRGSVAGITDVKTSFVFLDFDNEDNLEEARASTIEALKRLNALGIRNQDVDVCFSGSKGFSVTFELDEHLSPQEYKTFHRKLIGDLPGYDSSVVNASRVYRLPFTRHEKSGLYKHVLSPEILTTKTAAEIKELCKIAPSVKQYFYETGEKVKTALIKNMTIQTTKDKENPSHSLIKIADVSGLDFKNKIKGLTNCRWAILNGYASKGNRHNLYMALAASLKVLNFPKETAYYHIKDANEKNTKLTGEKPLSKEEIWTTIITSVYSPNWNNGTYTCKTEGFLRDYCKSLGTHKCNHSTEEQDLAGLDSVFPEFRQYAKDFDKNIMKSGIPALDRRCKFMAGTSSHILGPPGSGKCLAKGTLVRMYDGELKKVEDIKSGEQLMGDDSHPRNVLSTCSGKEEMFDIRQEKGKTYRVNRSHILSFHDFLYDKYVDMSIDEYLKLPEDRKKHMYGYRKLAHYDKKEVKLHPYILGLYLGGDDMEVYEKTLQRNDIISTLKEMNVWENKHVPKDYLINDVEVRRFVIAGLLDSFTNASNSRSIRFVDDVKLNDSLHQLVNSLGCYMQFMEHKVTAPTWKIWIPDMTTIPTAKLRDYVPIRELKINKSYVSIESVGEGEYFGFEIDGNKRFLLEDYTVTHNTSLALQILEYNSNKGIACLFFSLDMNKFNVITSIARRYFKFKAGEIDIYRDGARVECPDIEEMVMEHFRQETQKSKDIEKTILEKYKNVKFCFKPSYHVSQIQQAILEANESSGQQTKLVLIDYSELVNTDVSDPTQASAVVAQQCRHVAIETQAAFITLLQPNKQNSDVRKELTSYTGAKGSGAIAQSSQLMLSVSRPGFSPREPENDKYIVVNAVKNRSGALFTCDMKWEGEHGIIGDLSQEELTDLNSLRERIKEEENKSRGSSSHGDMW